MQCISSITLGAVQNGYHLPLIIPNKRITCWHTSMYNTLRHFCFLVSCMLVFPLSFHLIYSCHRANCTFPWLLLSAQLIMCCYQLYYYTTCITQYTSCGSSISNTSNTVKPRKENNKILVLPSWSVFSLSSNCFFRSDMGSPALVFYKVELPQRMKTFCLTVFSIFNKMYSKRFQIEFCKTCMFIMTLIVISKSKTMYIC